MKKILSSLILAFAVGLWLTGIGRAAEGPIRIGGLLETSGPVASLGKPGLEGAELAVEQANATGGINGRKIEFINLNTESDNTKSVSATKRLIEQYDVVGIVGAMNSGSSYSIISIIKRAGVPVIANGGSRGIVLPPEQKREIFLAPLTDVLVQGVMMKHMRSQGITKIALLNSDSAFGTSGREQLEKHASDYGLEIVIQETFGNSDTDMTPQLTNIRASAAQATVIWSTGPGQAIATKNYRQLGIDKPVYFSHAANDPNYVALAGEAAEGILVPSSKLYVAEQLPADDPQKETILRFIEAYKAKYGREPATFAGNGYDSMRMMIEAIRRAGTDRKAVRDAIENLKDFRGVTGIYTYSPTDHFGIQEESVVLLTVNNGRFVPAH